MEWFFYPKLRRYPTENGFVGVAIRDLVVITQGIDAEAESRR